MAQETLTTRCCIVGGGPAGMMLGFLLARAGIDVVVLEKHADFLRDFRGDTIHPSTLELMHELGLLDEFLKLPHQEARYLSARFGNTTVQAADFSHLRTQCRFIAFMPQWDFLNFLADHARRYPSFGLRMQTEVTDLVIEDGEVKGVQAKTPQGPVEIRATLTVGCDGRHSVVRDRAGLKVEDLGAPMDVLWFRISRRDADGDETMLMLLPGHIMIAINRGAYWQCAYVIPKGASEEVRRRGLPEFQDKIVAILPALCDRIDEIADWDAVKLLTVRIDRLKQWFRSGLLCIGDAAHAMSPVGGVGINLAVQDAVAAANILCESLGYGAIADETLKRVQRRREWPSALTQRGQVLIQNRVIAGMLRSQGPMQPPLPIKLLQYVPILRTIPAQLIGVGVRPEHIATPAVN